MCEQWRIVPSVPGLMVSSLGRYMVVPYTAPQPNGGVRQYGGTPSYGQDAGGRMILVIKGKSYKVHRLVCEAFNGAPEPGQVCMHLDEDHRNNRPENLKWGTQKENLNAPGFISYCKSRIGDDSPYRKGKAAK